MARRKTVYEARICRNPECGVEFTPRRKDQHYHKRSCRFAHWKAQHLLKPRDKPPSRREAYLLVLGWTIYKEERTGCIRRVWWRDPKGGKVHPQAEALQIARNR